jgi:hypothetical protein
MAYLTTLIAISGLAALSVMVITEYRVGKEEERSALGPNFRQY